MKPITRYERYLAYLGSDEDANGIDSPVTRIEQYLSKIAGQDVPIPEKPILRIEQYLAKIAGENVAIPEEPISRVEMYLAAIAGEEIEVPEPITREEWYLAQWAENGSGVLKTVSGEIVHILDALAKPLVKCEVTLEPNQSGSGDPSPENVRPITGHTGVTVYVKEEYDASATPTVSVTFPALGKNLLNTSKCTAGKTAFGLTSAIDGNYVRFTGTCSSGGGHTWKFLTIDSSQQELAATLSYSGFVISGGSGLIITGITFNSDNTLSIGLTGLVTNQQYDFSVGIVGYTGTAPSSFEPYTTTVYSGTMDLVSGKLKSAPYYAPYNGESLTGHWISDRDVYAEGTTPTTGAQVVNDGGTLSEYQLTPQEINALLGENNIWSNGTEIEVTYKAAASDG